MPNCSKCDFTGKNLGALRKHAAEVHPRPYKRRKKKNGSAEAPPPDRERALIDATSARFDAELQAEELDQAAYDRVIAYLRARYGSAESEAEAA